MAEDRKYDYIIAGAGCAGLSLAMHLLQENALAGRKLLIIEKEDKSSNDRTWCFWEEGSGLFQPVVKKEWKHLFFRSPAFEKPLDIHPYTYKLIRGIDFYNYCFDELRRHPNITILKGDALHISGGPGLAYTEVNGERFESSWLFSSILKKPELKKNDYWLLQHFKGWTIEYQEDVFDPDSATLMDFDTDQGQGATFFYVLPLSSKKALVEYTIFSKQLLPAEKYDEALEEYVNRKFGGGYSIPEKEFGVIPMTNHAFRKSEGRIINIGTAGGHTRGSTGYTFQTIQRSSKLIARNLSEGRHPLHHSSSGGRYRFYDSVLLRILEKETLEGSKIFRLLFEKNPVKNVLRFLDSESDLVTDIRIISTLPVLPFSKAAAGHFLT